MKRTDVTSDSYAEYNGDSNEKDPKFKVGDRVRISKNKNIFAKWYTPNWSEEVFVVSKIKIQFRWHTWLVTWVVNQFLEAFIKKSCNKQIKKNLGQKKCLKEKVINCTSNGKGMIIHLIVGLIKKVLDKILSLQMSQYFPKPFIDFWRNINVKVVKLSNYATKIDLKNVTHVDTSSFALKTN